MDLTQHIAEWRSKHELLQIISDPWIGVALIFTVATHLLRLDHAALWYDETFTAKWLALPWGAMVRTVIFGDYGANHLPFYFIVLKAWTSLVGISPWTLRLPSVVCSVMSVPLIAGIAGVLVGKMATRWAAWFMALSPYLLQHAQEARMYALLAVLATTSLWLLARYLSGSSSHLGFSFVVVSTVLTLTHYYAVFFVGAEILALLLLQPRPWRSWLPNVAISALITSVPVAAALLATTHHSGQSYEMGLLAFPGLIWSMLSGYTLLPSSEELHAAGLKAALPYLPAAAVGAIIFAILAIAGLLSMSRKAGVLLVVMISATVLTPFAVHLVFNSISVHPRYAITGLPALLILLAAGAVRLSPVSLRLASCSVLILIMLIASARHLEDPGHGREDIYAASKWLDERVPLHEEILITSREMAELADFHWPQRRFRLYPERRLVVDKANADMIAQEMPWTGDHRTVYMIGRSWLSDPSEALQKALKGRYAQCPGTEVRGIRILCLAHP